ncbi:MAG: hypothetical protein HUU35_12075, partial [Armatimonadetes bacterium]|nr:hypothetical protein [Armatimonadota bacterium]
MPIRYLMLALLHAAIAVASVERQGDLFAVSGSAGTVRFRASDGSIAAVVPSGGRDSVWQSGPEGLWTLRLRDNTTIQASSPGVTCRTVAQGDQLVMTYTSTAAEVTVTASAAASGVDLAAQVSPRTQAAVSFGLPARLRFVPGEVKQFVTPVSGSQAVGLALSGEFFAPQPEDHPAGWRNQPGSGGPAGYALLYGGPLDQKADSTPPVALTVDKQAEGWLSPTLAARLRASKVMVNRPPTRAQVDLVVVD